MKTKNTLFAFLTVVSLTNVSFGQEAGKSPLMCSVSRTMPKCHGTTDGQIDLNITGGFPPYSAVWGNGTSGTSLYEIGAGYYDVMIIDSHQDTISGAITMTEPNEIIVNGIVTNVSGAGLANGAIDVSISGLLETYSFSWGTTDGSGLDQSSFDQEGLKIGNYNLKVTSESGCIVEKSFRVHLSLMLDFQNITNVESLITNQGIVFPNPSNGPINFKNVVLEDKIEIYNSFGNLIQNPNTQEVTELPKGNYYVKITKADGTFQTEPLTIR
jgi:hypothetical protein